MAIDDPPTQCDASPALRYTLGDSLEARVGRMGTGSGAPIVSRCSDASGTCPLDRTRLLIDIVVTDPEYLVEPLTMAVEWDYMPKLRLLRFGCEPEQAKRYLSTTGNLRTQADGLIVSCDGMKVQRPFGSNFNP